MAGTTNVFEQLTAVAKQFDRQYLELGQKLNDPTARQPARTLAKLNRETSALQVALETELTGLRSHNARMEKTITMMKTLLKQKQNSLTEITNLIGQYTVKEDPPAKASDAASAKKTAASGETPCKEESVTPLKSIENLADEPLAQESAKEVGSPATPPGVSKDEAGIRTPRLTDYLPLKYMYGRLENDCLITKASKRSSTKKTPKDQHKPTGVAAGSVKSRKALVLSTPGEKGNASAPSTPVAPQLIKIQKPDFKKIPKPDFTGRIAMIDVEEYHSQIDGYIKQIISLELLNKVIHQVDLMFKLTPDEPVEKENLIKLVSPIASAKAKVCISLMIKLNRLSPVAVGSDSMVAVLGNRD